MNARKNDHLELSAQEISDYLVALGDPNIASHSQRFFKTAKGEYSAGDSFLGIRVPRIRQAVKKFAVTDLPTITRLLQSEYHEIRLFAVLLLVQRFSRHPREQEAIYQLYLDNTQQINNWDLVDSSAPHIVGAWLLDHERDRLYSLAASSSLWERRIAVMATFWFIREQQYDDTLRIASNLLDDPQDLIHKAVGWMLREIGKRDLETERMFLDRHYRKMPRTMLRYAIEKFDEPLRQAYLKDRIQG